MLCSSSVPFYSIIKGRLSLFTTHAQHNVEHFIVLLRVTVFQFWLDVLNWTLHQSRSRRSRAPEWIAIDRSMIWCFPFVFRLHRIHQSIKRNVTAFITFDKTLKIAIGIQVDTCIAKVVLFAGAGRLFPSIGCKWTHFDWPTYFTVFLFLFDRPTFSACSIAFDFNRSNSFAWTLSEFYFFLKFYSNYDIARRVWVSVNCKRIDFLLLIYRCYRLWIPIALFISHWSCVSVVAQRATDYYFHDHAHTKLYYGSLFTRRAVYLF